MQAAGVRTVSVFGLGKLGATMVACFAKKGFNVVGVDINENLVNQVRNLEAPFPEPRVDEFFKANPKRIRATLSPSEAVHASEISFVIVPTPSTPEGGFSAEYVCNACEEIGKALKEKSTWHMVVVTSTVLPTTMAREIIPVLERASGKKSGVDFDVCYSPLFIALGNIAQNILHPDFVLVGESTAHAGSTLETFYKQVVDNDAPIQRMNIINAEISKISVNAYVTTKISFANQLAEICEGLPGADADVVARAIGSDTRIGKKYLKAGTAFGGPCFPRDNRAFQFTARLAGTEAPLAAATDILNAHQTTRLVRLVERHLNQNRRVGILGMAYKPDTPVMEESPGLHLSRTLIERGFIPFVFDVMANEEARALLGNKVEIAPSMESVYESCDLIIVAQPVKAYAFRPADLKPQHRPTVIDCWGILDAEQWKKSGAQYVRLGKNI